MSCFTVSVCEGNTEKRKCVSFHHCHDHQSLNYSCLPLVHLIQILKPLLQDLLVAVGKLNSCLGTKRTMPDTFIQQDEIDMLGLGTYLKILYMLKYFSFYIKQKLQRLMNAKSRILLASRKDSQHLP